MVKLNPSASIIILNVNGLTNSKDTCTPMFIAALFTIVKTWKQSKCPSTDDCVCGYIYIYNEYYSAIIKKYCHLQQHGWT